LLHRVSVDDGLRNSLGRRALERAKAFSWQRCAEETYAALTDWS